MKPEPDDLPTILKKIEFGLPDEPSATRRRRASASAKRERQKDGG